MGVRGGSVGTTALVASLGFALLSGSGTARAASPEELEQRLRELEVIILKQQETIEAQARKLEQQDQRIADQGALLDQIWENAQGAESGPEPAAGPEPVGTPPDGVEPIWRTDPGEPVYVTQQQPPPVAPEVVDEEEPPAGAEAEGAEGTGPTPRAPVPLEEEEEEEEEAAPPAPPPVAAEEERPEPERPPEVALLERGAILLRPGTVQIEPSVEYSEFSADRIAIAGFSIFEAIIIGTIRVDQLRRDVLTAALTGRAGLMDRVQADVRVPGVYRADREVLGIATPGARERTTSVWGLGDISGGISVQPIIGDGFWPDIIVRVHGQAPTGTNPFEIETERIDNRTFLVEPPTGSGFYSAGATVTSVWRLDPAVVFMGGGYTLNFAREFSGFGRVDPGDSINYFSGMNLALTERVSVNLVFNAERTETTDQNDVDLPGSSFTDARLSAGASVGITPSMALLVSAAAGLTESSPDFTFTVSLPMTFTLF